MPLLKEMQLSDTASSLNLGNCEVCLFGRKFIIHLKGKRTYFHGKMSSGEWSIEKVWTFQIS